MKLLLVTQFLLTIMTANGDAILGPYSTRQQCEDKKAEALAEIPKSEAPISAACSAVEERRRR